MADLLMRIDNKSVKRLQRAFHREDCIKVDRFVEIICANVTRSELSREEVVEMALELFDQIDANGDGELHWSEFAAFVIELNHAHEILLNEREDLQITPVRDASMRINIQRKAVSVLVCEHSGTLCAVEAKSDQLRIHRLRDNNSLRPLISVRVTSNFISHTVVAGCNLESIGMAVVASRLKDEFFLSSFSLAKVVGQREQISTLSGQRILRWHPDSEILCTVGTGRGDAKGHVVSVFRRHARTGALLDTKPGRLIWHHKRISEMLFITHEHLATASEDGSIAIWNAATHENLGAVVAHAGGVLSFGLRSLVPSDPAALSSFWTRVKPETRLATFVSAPCPQFGGHISRPKDACAQIWEVTDGFKSMHAVAHLLGHEHPTTFCALVKSGAYVLTCDLSGEARLWNADRAFACVQKIQLGCTQLICLRDKIITVEVLHGQDAMFTLEVAEKERSPIVLAAFNHTMGCLVTATKHEVVLWDIRSGDRVPVICTPECSKRDITSACLDDRERKLIVGDESGRLYVYNLMNGALIKELDPHPLGAPVTSAHFCAAAKDRLVITTSWSGALHVSDESDRAGFQEDKHSVRLRSILVGDAAQANVGAAGREASASCHDLLVSAVSFHLKQIATFAERRGSARATHSCGSRGVHAKSDEPEEESVICIWDLEFARLVGVCRADRGSQFVGLEYVNGGAVPLLVGLDAAHAAVSVWMVGGADRHRRFGRIAKLPVPPGMVPTALRVHDASTVLIGFESGAVMRMELETAIPKVDQAVRVTTFRGNRLVRQATRQQDIQRSLATTPYDKFADVSLRQAWLSGLGPQVHDDDAGDDGDAPEIEAQAVATLSVISGEGLVIVGGDAGTVRLLSLEDGALRGTLDAFSGKVAPPLARLIDLSHAQADKMEKVKELLPGLPSPRPPRKASSDAASVQTLSTVSTLETTSGGVEPQTEHQRFDRAASVLFKRLQALRHAGDAGSNLGSSTSISISSSNNNNQEDDAEHERLDLHRGDEDVRDAVPPSGSPREETQVAVAQRVSKKDLLTAPSVRKLPASTSTASASTASLPPIRGRLQP